MRRTPVIGTISWKKYKNFFELWMRNKKKTRMFYIMGGQHYIYIGVIGIRGGKQGLGNRYQKQYLNMSKAIFGKDEKAAQIAYAGFFEGKKKKPVPYGDIEKHLQKKCIEKYGAENVIFTIFKGEVKNIFLTHKGDVPEFCQSK